MAMISKKEAPLAAAEGNTPAYDECKGKVVDSIEAKRSCKFKADPLMMKEDMEIEFMR